MRNKCLRCGKEFSGRSDKRFCSLECKNSHHNSQRRQEYFQIINNSLIKNRSILQKLIASTHLNRNIEKVVLENQGFRFDLVTGYQFPPEGAMVNKVYEYTWIEMSDSQVFIDQDISQINNELPAPDETL